jgi:hypothetical protein
MGNLALPPDDRVRALASEILSRGDYARYRVDEKAWRDLFERLQGWWHSFEVWLAGLADTSPGLYALVVVGAFLLAALLLGHALWSVRAALRASPAREPLPPEPSADFSDEVRNLASSGLFLDAARALQRACLRLLIERGQLELARADANRTLRRRLAGTRLPESQRRELARLIDLLEERTFRDGTQDAALYQSWLRLHGALRRGSELA